MVNHTQGGDLNRAYIQHKRQVEHGALDPNPLTASELTDEQRVAIQLLGCEYLPETSAYWAAIYGPSGGALVSCFRYSNSVSSVSWFAERSTVDHAALRVLIELLDALPPPGGIGYEH